MTSLANTALFDAVLSDVKSKQLRNIVRAQHNRENPYTLISNKVLRDTTIRHNDRGILCQLLSWSDAHRLCIEALVKKSVEGRDAIRSSIDRLIKSGYIIKNTIKNGKGQYDTVTYTIFEEPQGVPKSEINLDGIVEDESDWSQLELFSDSEGNVMRQVESGEIDQFMESVNQSTDGFTVNGKADTNNNYDSRNTINNNNSVADEIALKDGKVDKGSLLRRFSLSIDNPQLRAKIGIAGLSTFLTSQDQLDHFLIDFNQQHETYAHLNDSKRLHNFVAYLVRMKTTPHFYKMHVTRMKALGIHLTLPDYKGNKSNANTGKQERIRQQQVGCNPFEVVQQSEPVVLSEAYLASLKGF